MGNFAGLQSGIPLAYWLESMRVWRNRLILLGGLVLLGGADGGACGLGAPIDTPVLNLSADGGPGGLRWVGVDPRPLAVGTTSSLSFELGAEDLSSEYEVNSDNPTVISVADEGNQILRVTALSAGTADIDLFVEGSPVGSLQLTSAQATSIVFADPSHLAAGIDGGIDLPLPPGKFGILANQQETIEAIITDDAGDPLAAAQALATGVGEGVSATPVPPSENSVASAGFLLEPGINSTATFSGSLTKVPSSALTYDIDIVQPSAVVSAVLETRTDADGNVYALAIAEDSYGNEIFGLGIWTFVPSGGATAEPLAPAAAKIIIPDGALPGSVTLTATNGALTVTTQLP